MWKTAKAKEQEAKTAEYLAGKSDEQLDYEDAVEELVLDIVTPLEELDSLCTEEEKRYVEAARTAIKALEDKMKSRRVD